MFIGDWNTGAHKIDEKGRTFVCSDEFRKLSARGWTDLWRHHNPGTTEFTWYSKLKGGARERVPARSCFRYADPPAARDSLPLFARTARCGRVGSLNGYCGGGATGTAADRLR
jgi:hypothetical protein